MIQRNLSFSQIKSWQECKRAWAYKFRDGYRPKAQKLEFMRGTMLHLGMEHGIICRPSWWYDAMAEWHKEYGTDDMIVEPGWFEGCKEIVQGALDVFHQDWKVLSDETGILLERRMYIDLPDYYKGVVFVPDAVCQKRQEPYAGGIFGIDFKSFGKPKEAIYSDVDLQSVIYQKGLHDKGYYALGSCIFQMATEPRKAVRIKKDGEPYAGDQERYDNWRPVNEQLLSVRSEDVLERFWEQAVLPVIQEMYLAEVARVQDQPPHLSYYGCKYCEFFAPCQARLKGHDEDDILADQFTRRGERQKGA